MCECLSFPFGFKDGMCDLNVLIPHHNLHFYFLSTVSVYFIVRRNIRLSYSKDVEM